MHGTMNVKKKTFFFVHPVHVFRVKCGDDFIFGGN